MLVIIIIIITINYYYITFEKYHLEGSVKTRYLKFISEIVQKEQTLTVK